MQAGAIVGVARPERMKSRLIDAGALVYRADRPKRPQTRGKAWR
jgi:hypothetical protein